VLLAAQSDVRLQADQLQQQLMSAEQRAAAATSFSERTIKDLQQQLSVAQQDARDRIRLLQQQLVLEKDRLQAERENHSTTQRQLQDARQQLNSAVARFGEAEAAAAAAEGRAVKAEMQATTMAGSDTQVSVTALKAIPLMMQMKRQMNIAKQVVLQLLMHLPNIRALPYAVTLLIIVVCSPRCSCGGCKSRIASRHSN
jgi:hypothetical protein